MKVIKSGDHIHLSSVASAPQCLIKAMCERGAAKEFRDVHVHHLHTEGPAPYADPQFEGIFQLDSFFVGSGSTAAAPWRQRAQGDSERLCGLHSDLSERDAAALPQRRRGVRRGHDPGVGTRLICLIFLLNSVKHEAFETVI